MQKRYINKIINGYSLEINIVNKCNLNCAGCDHFAPLGDDNMVTSEDLLNQLKIITNQLPNLKEVILLGGEPLLNPDLYNICLKIKNNYPNIGISFITNGLLLKQWTTEDYSKYQNLNVGISVTRYPDIDYSFLPKLNNINYLSTRFLFQDTKVDIYGSQNLNHFYICSRDNSVGFILNNYKLYFCPYSSCVHQFFNKYNIQIEEIDGVDYLDIHNLSLERIKDFCNMPKNICKYCPEKQEVYYWSRNNNNDLYLEYTQSKRAMYLTNYENYYLKCNDSSLYKKLKANNLWENIDPIYCSTTLQNSIHRFENSKIDIIIPYNKVNYQLIYSLQNELLSQTFIDNCTIYLISDESPQEDKVYDIFNNSKLHCVFLKTEKQSGPGVARNLGIEESFGEYIYFLDFDDSFGDEKTLEFLYSKKENLDFLIADMYDEHQESKQINRPVLIKSSFLKNKNIRYEELFLNEDAFFFAKLFLNSKNYKKIDYIAYRYNRNNDLHITSLFSLSNKDILINDILYDMFLFLYLSKNNILKEGKRFFKQLNKLNIPFVINQKDKQEIIDIYQYIYIKIKKLDINNILELNNNYNILNTHILLFNSYLKSNKIIPDNFKNILLTL